jgi:aerobic-type carbon monoxide dehydrogenase small subunit (CoxS/CutS family)
VSLLSALREDLGVRQPVKDGCSPQGQCGCCTVLVDGSPRVSCVTAVRRVAGRSVVTAAGLDPDAKSRLVDAFSRHGASQCGFCTPGILCRLAALGPTPQPAKVETALLAHLCRCTGWRTIIDAACDQREVAAAGDRQAGGQAAAERRAALEGGVRQQVGPNVILGAGGFADDDAPPGCLVAVPDGVEGWAVGETLEEARAASGKVQGRRSGQQLSYPVEVPPGDWALTLQTTWVEPAYLELDSSWCKPGGEPANPVANGGAFGGKLDSVVPAAARRLAELHGRPVRVVLSREDTVRLGPKRPPIAAGIRPDGTGIMRVAVPGPSPAGAATAREIASAISAYAPSIELDTTQVAGPPLSANLRAAGWAEAAVLLAGAKAWREGSVPESGPGSAAVTVRSPAGAEARAVVATDPTGWPTEVRVTVACGPPLDEVTLRSYITGAAHMALGWVCSEGIAVGEDGVPTDLTIRSFGILRARETPPIDIEIDGDAASRPEPLNGSDAAFAAVAAATWIAQGLPSRWPTRRGRNL